MYGYASCAGDFRSPRKAAVASMHGCGLPVKARNPPTIHHSTESGLPNSGQIEYSKIPDLGSGMRTKVPN